MQEAQPVKVRGKQNDDDDFNIYFSKKLMDWHEKSLCNSSIMCCQKALEILLLHFLCSLLFLVLPFFFFFCHSNADIFPLSVFLPSLFTALFQSLSAPLRLVFSCSKNLITFSLWGSLLYVLHFCFLETSFANQAPRICAVTILYMPHILMLWF